ncbi:MAG: aromatic ring-hydroxylating dioxygenase subunit alpha [Deltaproteobacteria bacterium]|nr:aromatic ring-hydroxylating dioxygenase subunit alpha [Deltaproteobacteria bacterium]
MGRHPNLLRLAERLLAHIKADTLEMAPDQWTLPVSHYCSDERLARERETLFRRYPIVVAHASELDAPGSCLRHDALGVPLLLVRGEDSRVRCFLNVCRHRGMRLVSEDGACRRKALVCPYHGWTYGLDGTLLHVPHAEAFPELRPETRGLVSVALESRHGLLWVRPTPGPALDLDTFLGPIADDLESFALSTHVVYRRIDTVRRANWKLVIDAFLEAYHIRVLHRDTIYRFFLDARAVSDFVGPHVRSLAARRAAKALVGTPPSAWDLREHFTFTHFVFPNSVFIFHPDYVSHITVFPVDADHVRWVHAMLVPSAVATEDRRPHWDRTLALIEETVFQREDLFAAEGIQTGLRSGANQSVTFGRLESALHHFHATIERSLAPEP